MPNPNSVNPATGKRYAWEAEQRALNAAAIEAKELDAQLRTLDREKKLQDARRELLPFVEYTMPDPADASNPNKTMYEAAAFHKEVAKALEAVERGEIRQLIFCMPPRHGKSCAHDTPVLTSTGWVEHGALKIGDYVFGPDGATTEVIALSEDVDEVVPVTLSNGEVIRCHPNHEWKVYDRAQRQGSNWRVLETRDIAKRVLRNGSLAGRGGRWTLQLPDVEPLIFNEAILPIHPYVLGAWLGDGYSSSSTIAHAADDTQVVAGITACGYAPSVHYVQAGTGVHYTAFGGSGLIQALKKLGVRNNKHIPEMYLRSSIEQRLQILAGLVDTDGHVEMKTGRVRFSTCSEELRDGVYDLATTLGFRPYITAVLPVTSSSGIVGRKITYQVGFQPTCALPTRIPRKQITVFAARRRIGIVSVGPVEKAPARSICVARPDGLYLVGRQLAVTKNTELATKRLAAWYSGRHPSDDIIVAAAGDSLATDFGGDVRAIMQSPHYKHVFPAHKLRKGGTAKDNIQTVNGGRLIFAGRGGQINGRGAHLLLIDDLYKDHEEARSQTIRDQAWNWFTKVALYRRMGKRLTIITMTRWHSDDIIGRLTDPENPHYNAAEAQAWKIIRLPGLAEENDPAGRQEGEALWPERYDVQYHMENQRRDPLGFAALTQQRPTVADGVLFRRENIQRYDPQDVPENLRFYCASDHAVKTGQRNDYTCMGKAGVDRQDNLWFTELFLGKVTTDKQVEIMLSMASGTNAPLIWWAGRDHITGSIGPFLYKRMAETKTYFAIREMSEVGDKEQKAQSIAARVALGKVYIPNGGMWDKLVDQMLAFPNGTNDDAVDMLSLFGRGLQSQFGKSTPAEAKARPKFGTLAWVKENDRWAEEKKRQAEVGGF